MDDGQVNAKKVILSRWCITIGFSFQAFLWPIIAVARVVVFLPILLLVAIFIRVKINLHRLAVFWS